MPTRCESVIIDPVKFLKFAKQQNQDGQTNDAGSNALVNDTLIPVSIYPTLATIICPGIEIRGFTTASVSREKQEETLTVEKYHFVSYFDQQNSEIKSALSSVAQIVTSFIYVVLDNSTTTEYKVLDIFAKAENSSIQQVISAFNSAPNRTVSIHMISTFAELDKIDPSIKNLAQSITSQDTLDNIVLGPGRGDLVFLDDIKLLQTLSKNLQNNSYVILITPWNEMSLTEQIRDNHFNCVSQKQSENTFIHLLRKVSVSLTQSSQITAADITALCVDSNSFDWLPNLQDIMSEAANEPTDSNKKYFLYSHQNPQSGIIGLVKCLKNEPGGNRIRCIFDPERKLNLNFANPDKELKNIIDQDLVMNVIKKGQLGSFIHVIQNQDLSSSIKHVESAYVDIFTAGDLTSLRWIESPLNKLDVVTNVCSVNYAGLNFKDIMLATGKLSLDLSSQDCQLGLEYSGTDTQGNRIMGILPGKALATSVVVDPLLNWKIPGEWSMEEAVTVPIVYSTVFFALCSRGRLQPSQSVLIHSGTGGVGQAAIRVALHLNCEVYTTVGSEAKRKILKEIFPTIKDRNIGNSRDCSFEPQIMELTKGRGVDMVLNSLAGEKLHASVRCLAMHGKFIEIGKFDISQNASLGMSFFVKNIEFHGVFIDSVFTGTRSFKNNINKLVMNGIKKGIVKPLSRTVFANDRIEDAFRFMASGKHIGKVIIEIQKEENVKEKNPKVTAAPRTFFHPRKSYVIVGGLGGLGLEVANWMVDRGAKHLVLTSRSGVKTGYQELCLKKWREQAVKVETPIMDLSIYDIAEKFVKSLTVDAKQIGGIINSGLLLKDALIEDQTIQNFKDVAAPKVDVTKNLDKLTREYCRESLDYFVVFSSVSCGRGNVGQSNYGWANSVMESICESRRENGLPGLAIQWGMIGEVGVVAETMLKDEGSFQSYLPQRVSSCLEVLDIALNYSHDAATISSALFAKKELKQINESSLIDTISHILGIKNPIAVEKLKPFLVEFGMDSLMGAEISQLLDKKFGISLTTSQLRNMTLANFEFIESGTYNSPDIVQENNSLAPELFDIFDCGHNTMVELSSAVIDETTNLFMIHGADGHSLTFQALAEKLKCRTFAFQFGTFAKKRPVNEISIQNVTQEYLKEIRMVQPEGPFNILCYCSGTSIAFEIIRLHENEMGQQIKNFFVLDGYVTKKDLFPSGNRQVELKGIAEIATTFVNIQELTETFKRKYSFENYHLNAPMTAKLVKSKYPNIDYKMLKRYCENAFAIWKLFEDYEASPTFVTSAQVTLIKSSNKVDLLADVTDDKHNIQKYRKFPVAAHSVSGNHFAFLQHQNVGEMANLINDILVRP